MSGRDFLVYAPDFDENSGGAVVLHRLCDLLNREGRRAFLAPMSPPLNLHRPLSSARDIAQHWVHRTLGHRLRTFPDFDTPVVTRPPSRDVIAIYPEVIAGNPLRAECVVRWLLHKPGFHTGRFKRGPSDLLFWFQQSFRPDDPDVACAGQLQVFHFRGDVYRQTNFGARRGVCYLVRKGAGRKPVHDADARQIDGLSHAEAAQLFNSCEMFISYDPYTLYSQYAALCGCKSVVVPQEGTSKEAWQPTEALRWGIAYGFDDLDWAARTLPKVREYFLGQEALSRQSVREFIASCDRAFG